MNTEDKIKFGKMRGGRGTHVHKDKSQYDRQRDKKDVERDIRREVAGVEDE